MDCTIFVNGMQAGEWKYGYSSFEVRLTPFLKTGENTILVHVRYQSPNSRWYSGAGIYRSVWLKGSSCPHSIRRYRCRDTPYRKWQVVALHAHYI